MKKFWKWINQTPNNLKTQSGSESAEVQTEPKESDKPNEASKQHEPQKPTEPQQPTERILELCGTIAESSWLDDDVTPRMFKDELFAGTGPVTIWLNSPGGDCIAASRIYSMLMDYKDDITVKIDGMAASAASVIAMAGTTVQMAPTAMMMIHNPMTTAYGDHGELEKAIDMLSEVKESIINAYEIKTGLPRKQLARMMDEETWMNAKKAMELGFADSLLKDEKLITADEQQGYAFSAVSAERNLINKLSAVNNISASAKITDKADVNTLPMGRKVSDLRDSLYRTLL